MKFLSLPFVSFVKISRDIRSWFPIGILKRDEKNRQLLGRWNIENCHKKVDHKVDLSNEDHCGPCGQYILDKRRFPSR